MTNPPIILVPGLWLGAWAWDEVAGLLRAEGFEVTPLTLPGFDPDDGHRLAADLSDQVDAIVEAIDAAGPPVVLAVHSASGFPGYAASDRVPDKIAAMVYVDTAPGISPEEADFEGDQMPPPSLDELRKNENLDGLSDDQLATFERRAVSVPGGVLSEAISLTNDARNDIPSTVIATGYTSADYGKYAAEHPEWPFLAGLPKLRNLQYVDLPTSHWPMWSKPKELAAILADVARAHAS